MEKIKQRTLGPMKIGAFARATGVGIETVRYYQRRGLLEKPPGDGPRIYSEQLVERMAFIRRAQALGFTLEEIRKLLVLAERDCASGKDILGDKLRELDARVVLLNRMRARIRRYLVMCDLAKRGDPCPFIRILSEPENPKAR